MERRWKIKLGETFDGKDILYQDLITDAFILHKAKTLTLDGKSCLIEIRKIDPIFSPSLEMFNFKSELIN